MVQLTSSEGKKGLKRPSRRVEVDTDSTNVRDSAILTEFRLKDQQFIVRLIDLKVM